MVGGAAAQGLLGEDVPEGHWGARACVGCGRVWAATSVRATGVTEGQVETPPAFQHHARAARARKSGVGTGHEGELRRLHHLPGDG